MVLSILTLFSSVSSFADCQKVEAGKKESFDGKSLKGLAVEKKSLPDLERLFPNLRSEEKVLIGALQTCTNCTDNYVSCN